MGDAAFRGSIESARKWHALAERRRRHYVELYRSERWRRYFKEETFLELMREAIQNTEHWAKILERIQPRTLVDLIRLRKLRDRDGVACQRAFAIGHPRRGGDAGRDRAGQRAGEPRRAVGEADDGDHRDMDPKSDHEKSADNQAELGKACVLHVILPSGAGPGAVL